MTLKIQKKIEFNSECKCLVDYSELEKAILCSELQARIIYQAFNSAVVSDLIEGKSINWIASHYGCDWSTIRNRIYENPGLVEVSS